MTGPDAILNNEGLLSDASIEALELQHQPFAATPVGGELFEDESTRALIADINSALYGNDDVLLVLGTVGSGRTTLLRQLASNTQSRIACFSVKGSARFDTAHLFGSILQAFKAPVPPDLKDALDALIPNLQGTFERYNRLSTIVLDDADQVPVEELTKLLSSVLYLNGHEEPLLRVLLSSTPDFEDRLPEALPEGAEIRYASLLIEPYETNRAESYLEFRLNQAGYFENFPFTDRDTQSILDTSGGYPGPLNVAAALNLNEQHGQLPDSILPDELVETRRNGSVVKMLLGGLACLMILAGLFMFTQTDGERSPAASAGADEYRTVETVDITPSTPTTTSELEIVNQLPNTDSGANTDSQLAANSATQPSEPNANGSSAADAPASAAGNGANSNADNSTSSEANSDATTGDQAAAPANSENLAATNAEANSDANPQTETEAEAQAESQVESETSEQPAAQTTKQATATADASDTNSDEALLADTNSEPTPTATASTAGADNNIVESSTWILVQDPDSFTVQMSASTDKASVESFLRRNDLPGPNSIFSFNRNGATWYALVHGLFDDVPSARTALKALPEGALRNQPWIRRIGQVQNALKEQN